MQNILVVEDDTNIAADVKSRLIEEGFQVEVAYDGLLAEKLILRNTYDCVVLDINLPGKNGYEVCRSIRNQNNGVPVLMLTAFGEVEDKLNGFENGADDYLTKPFYIQELLARIRALLKRGPSREDNEKLLYQDITIDLRAKKIFRGGQLINFTAREYEIVEELVKAKGNVVSKKELIRKIWGTSVQVNTNTIEVFINAIRNKLDKGFDLKLIQTRPGFGYYLRGDEE